MLTRFFREGAGGDSLGECFLRLCLGGGDLEADFSFLLLDFRGGAGDSSEELPEDDSASEPDALGDLSLCLTTGETLLSLKNCLPC